MKWCMVSHCRGCAESHWKRKNCPVIQAAMPPTPGISAFPILMVLNLVSNSSPSYTTLSLHATRLIILRILAVWLMFLLVCFFNIKKVTGSLNRTVYTLPKLSDHAIMLVIKIIHHVTYDLNQYSLGNFLAKTKHRQQKIVKCIRVT